jgi:outer membrane receptor protein involved in Fe transport
MSGRGARRVRSALPGSLPEVIGAALWALVACLIAAPTAARAGGDEPDLGALSIEELMQVPVEVATRAPELQHEAPGVVTVITREEIIRSGARDLIDVLHLVPGFAFGIDVGGVVGVGFRGHWGMEGKVLLLLDDQKLNEPLFLTTQFGNHIPVEHIERIEIIRGPGSVLYGGEAELAVIRIITRGAADLRGGQVAATYGQMAGSFGRRNLSASLGQVFDFGLALSISGLFGEGRRSDQLYRDLVGNAYPLTEHELNPRWINVGASWQGLDLRLILEEYRTTTRDGLGESLPEPARNDFRGLYVDLRYLAELGSRLTLTPRVQYKRNTPWRSAELPQSEPVFYDKTAERILGGAYLEWSAIESLDLLFGAEAFLDRAWLNDEENLGVGAQFPLAGSFHTLTGFGQAIYRHRIANLSAGARYEWNSRYGAAFLPKAAVTRSFGRLYTKLLYSEAFRAPGHENFALNPDLLPERTRAWELEVGQRIGEHLMLGVNLFDLVIRHPIIFFVDEATGTDNYINAGRVGTRGVEGSLRLATPSGGGSIRYSFYDASGRSDVPLYAVPGRAGALRAFPRHKLAVEGYVPLVAGLTFGPSLVLLGWRYGTLEAGPDGTARVGREEPTALVNAFLTGRDILVRGLELGVGVHDLFDQRVRFLQPYDAIHTPMPGPSREVVVRAAFEYSFD